MPYADVNGLHLYYEEHGEGRPLLLLHGGLMTIELNFGVTLPALAQHHRVIAVEFQGHGRTADLDRPPTVPDFAADVVALLDHLGIERADVVGFSVGGLTGYELAISYPMRVRRAVLASADHRNDRAGEADPARLPTQDDFQAMRDAYAAIAPDPGAFDVVAEKTSGMVQSFTGWADDQLRNVQLPVLILVGDTDFILVENAAEVDAAPAAEPARRAARHHAHGAHPQHPAGARHRGISRLTGPSLNDRPSTGRSKPVTQRAAGQDAVAVFGAHGRPDWPEVVGGGDSCQLVHRRNYRMTGNDACRGRSAQIANEVPKAGVVVHEQDPRLSVTDHPERVRHTAGHRDPVTGSDDELVVTTAHDHLSIEDVPGVVEVVVDVQRGRSADRQGHLQHDGVHLRRAAMFNDQGVEEPPRLRLFVLGGVNYCCRHFGNLL